MARFGIKGRVIVLYARFLDSLGNSVVTDTTPKVKIIDTNGKVQLSSTNVHTSAELDDPGLYRFEWPVPLNTPDGYWQDQWNTVIGGETVTNTFKFFIQDGGVVGKATEPDYQPDTDTVDFEFRKCEADGIAYLMHILKKRLKNDGTVKVSDGAGGFIDKACPIFSDDELTCFLVNSLSEFNQYPHFTSFTFCDQDITNTFADIIIQGALLLALSAQSLIERGREFTITDQGVSWQPPAVSDMLNTQYSTQLNNYMDKLRMIKSSLKPRPAGLGTFRVVAVNPNYLRLRHLRQRQVL